MKNLRGSVSIFFIILIVAIGSYLLVGGAFPNDEGVDSPTYEAIPDENAPRPSGKESLQLGTFPFKQCSDTISVDFLIDNSGSMAYGSKMVELKNAMVVFGSNYPDNGLLGLQIYSDVLTYPPLGYQELIPISEYKNIKNQYVGFINTMRPQGATHSKDAMAFAKTKIDQARSKYPNRKFNLIFISDGIPETEATKNRLCPIGGIPDPNLCSRGFDPNGRSICRCFAEEQNPTSIAQQIKNSGVRIFTIYYVDQADAKFTDMLKKLMEDVASSPSDSFQAPAEAQLINILGQIVEKLGCSKL